MIMDVYEKREVVVEFGYGGSYIERPMQVHFVIHNMHVRPEPIGWLNDALYTSRRQPMSFLNSTSRA